MIGKKVDLGSLVLLMSIFESKVAIIYVIVGLVTYFYPEVTVEKMSTYRKKQ